MSDFGVSSDAASTVVDDLSVANGQVAMGSAKIVLADIEVPVPTEASPSAIPTESAGLGDPAKNEARLAVHAPVRANSAITAAATPAAATQAPPVPALAHDTDTGSSTSDGITADATPVVTGAAAANAKITLYDTDGTTVLGTTTANAAGAYSVAVKDGLSDGNHTLSVTATASGLDESPPSPGLSVTIDTVAPDAPTAPIVNVDTDTGLSQIDGVTSSQNPILTGAAEPGSTIKLYANGDAKEIADAHADHDGHYSITAPTLDDGTYQLTVTATDRAGNESKPSAATSVTIDRTAPDAPPAPLLSPGSDSGTLRTDGLTNDRNPILTGTAEAGAQVQLYDGTTALGAPVTADAAGQYVIAAPTLDPGQHQFSVTTTDAAGNASTASDALLVDIETAIGTATSTPFAAPDAASSVWFKIHLDQPGRVDSPAAFKLVATGSAKGTIQYLSGAGQDYTVLVTGVSGEGGLRLDLTGTNALTDAGNLFQFTESDVHEVSGTNQPSSQLVSAASDGSARTADSLGSSTASGGFVAFSSDDAILVDGPSNVDPKTGGKLSYVYVKDLLTGAISLIAPDLERFPNSSDTNASTPSLSGYGGVIAFNSSAALTPDATAGTYNTYVAKLASAQPGSGESVTIVPGSLQLVSQGNDQQGSSELVPNYSDNLYTEEYFSPFVSPVVSADGTMVAFSSRAQLTAGQDPTNTALKVYVKNLNTGALTLISGGGDADPRHDSVVNSISALGNVITYDGYDDKAINPDNATPGAYRSFVYNANTGKTMVVELSEKDLALSNPNATSYYETQGAVVAGDGVNMTFEALGTVDPGQDEAASYEENLSTGAITYVGPSALDGGYPSPSGDGGLVLLNDDQTNGQLGLYSPATGTNTAIDSGFGALAAFGNAVTTFLPSTDDQYTGTLVDTDLGVSVSVDPVGAAGYVNAAAAARLQTDGLTITGSSNAPAGSRVAVHIAHANETGATPNVYTTVGADGTWMATIPGSYFISVANDFLYAVAQVKTSYGYSPREPRAYVVDVTAPDAPTAPRLAQAYDSDAAHDGKFTNSASPLLTGSTEARAIVTLYDANAQSMTPLESTVADANGAYAIMAPDLSEGAHTLFATATDAAGNVSAVSGKVTFTVDTKPPAPPSVPRLSLASDTGVSNNDSVTSNATPTFIGTAEPGTTITLYDSDGKAVLGTAITDAEGNYSVDSGALSDGSHTVSVTATDAAGNISKSSGHISLRIDTLPPGAPTDLAVDGTALADGTLAPFLEVTGTADPGQIVDLHVDGDDAVTATASVNESGEFTIDADSLQPGDHMLTVIAHDTAGNYGQASLPISVTITNQPTPPPDAPSNVQTIGSVSDGEISGATVFADANGDGAFELGEAHTVTRTGGGFTLFGGSGELIAIAGTDAITGLTLPGAMRAPFGATAITPLTTLQEAYGVALGSTATTATPDALNQALGLPVGTDFATTDASQLAHLGSTITGFEINAVSVQIIDTAVEISNVVVGAGGTAFDHALQAHAFGAVFDVIARRIAAGGFTIGDLQDASAVSSILVDAAAQVAPELVLSSAAIDATGKVVATGNAAIAQKTSTLAADLPGEDEYDRSNEYNAAIQYIDAVEKLEQGSAASALQFGGSNDSLADRAVTQYTGAGFTAAVAPPTQYTFVPFELAQGSDTGLSDQDNVTADTDATFTGTALPGSTITLITPGGDDHETIHVLGSTVVDAAGHFSVTVALPITTVVSGNMSVPANATIDQIQAILSGPKGTTAPAEGDRYPDGRILETDVTVLSGFYSQGPSILDVSDAPGPGSDASHARLVIEFQDGDINPVEIERYDVYADGGTTPIASFLSDPDAHRVVTSAPLAAGSHVLTITETLVSGTVVAGSTPFDVQVTPEAMIDGTASAGAPLAGGTVEAKVGGSYAATTSLDASGAYVFPATFDQYLTDGWDKASGLPLFGSLSNYMPVGDDGVSLSTFAPTALTAPAGATIITPFTHMIDALAQFQSPADTATVEAHVLHAFDLPPTLDLLSLDPLALARAGDPTTFLLAEKLLDTANLVTAAGTTGYQEIAAYINVHGTIDLDDPNQIATLLRYAGVSASLTQQLAATIVASNAAIDAAAASSTGPADLVARVLAIGTVAQGAETSAFIEANGRNGRDATAAAQTATAAFTGAALDQQIDAALGGTAQVVSFAPADMATTSNAASVIFRISFSQAVTGLASSEFGVVEGAGLIDAHVTGITAVSGSGGTAYDVAVSTGVGAGALSLTFDGTNLLDAGGRPLTGGNFEPAKTYYNLSAYGFGGGYVPMLATGDFNSDGKTDVVQVGGSPRVFLNQGGGVLAPRGPIQTASMLQANTLSVAVAVGDFNGDNKLDVVTANYDGNNNASVSTMLGNGDGTFRNPTETIIGGFNSDNGLAVGDLDGDGKLDVVSLDSSGIGVLLGNGDGSFHQTATMQLPSGYASSPISSESLAVADVNGDGKLDIIALDNQNSAVDIFLGKGDGTFSAGPEANVPAGNRSTAMAVGDVNGDGIADIVTTVLGENSNPTDDPSEVTLLLGKGDGTFRPATSIALPGIAEYNATALIQPDSIAIGDVNNDGTADLVVDGDNQLVLLGDGTGTFTLGQAMAHASSDQAVALADLDGDGRTDLVASGPSSNLGTDLNVELNAPQSVLAEPSTAITIDRSGLAQPSVLLASGSGSLVRNGNTYTLALGTIAQGATPAALVFAIANAASGPADALGGSFGAPSGDGFVVTGAALSAALDAGDSYEGLTFTPDTNTPGQHSETITFAPRDQSATTTRYSFLTDTDDSTSTTTSVDGANVAAQLPPLTLVVTEDVVAGAPPASPPPAALSVSGTLAFGNVRVGDTDSQAISVSNTAASGADTLSVGATASGNATVRGSAASVAPGATDATDIVAGLATGAAGAILGTVTLHPSSVDASGAETALAAMPVAISGKVFRPASARIASPSAIVHVGDSGIIPIAVANGDTADGFSEALIASLGTLSSSLTASSAGPTNDIDAGAADHSLAVRVSTASPGTVSGTVGITLFSDGGSGAGSIDGLGKIDLANQIVPVSVTIDNYAVANIGDTVNGISQSGNATLDLGSVAIGSTPLTVSLAALNTASGPADPLGGSFSATGSDAFANTFHDVAAIAAGNSASAGTVTLSTAEAGQFSETVSFAPTGSNASGYAGTLAVRTLTIMGTVTPGAAPTVMSVTTSGPGIHDGNGDLGPGRQVTFTVHTSAPVGVAGGTPALVLNDGGKAQYAGGSGTDALTFVTTIVAGQSSPDLAVTGVDLAGATIRDTNGEDADLSGVSAQPAGRLVVATAVPATPPATLTVQEDSGPTAIGIVAPADPGYSPDQLSAKITAVPSDGSIALADGAAVELGETLSIDQLTGLTFTAATGMFSESATLTYMVADPAQNSAAGYATLAIGAALPPTIAGAVAGQMTSDAASLNPFASVTITDPSAGQTEAVTVTPDKAADGTLSDPNGASDGGSFDTHGGYSITGSVSTVSAALQGLLFTPTRHQVAPGDSETTHFTIAATNGAGRQAVDTTTSVVAAAAADAPVIGGTLSGQTIDDTQTIQPFSQVTLSDPDLQETETTTITLSADGHATDSVGTLSGGGLSHTGIGTYLLSAASPASEQAALRGLVFAPSAGSPGDSVTTTFVLQTANSVASTSDANTVVTVDTAPITPPGMAAVTLALASDSGASSSDAITASDTLIGTANPGDVISISNGTAVLGNARADAAGHYSFIPMLADGSYELTATDGVGTAPATLSFTLDTSKPVVTAPSLAVAINAGATAIGIQASDGTEPSGQLVARIDALPTDGIVTLNGAAVTAGQTMTAAALAQLAFTHSENGLSAAQVPQLLFSPGADLESSSLTYSVMDLAGNKTTASASLVITAPQGGGHGDVHMTTFDGQHYDFQATGDFIVAQAKGDAANGFAIQMHADEYRGKHGTSVATEIAARVGRDVIQFSLHGNPVTINGQAVTLDASGTDQLAAGSLHHVGQSWIVDWDSGEKLSVTSEGDCLDFVVTPGAQVPAGSLQGLLGSDTGWANDFQLRDGTALKQPLSKSTLLGEFADAWRVGQGQSLLADMSASTSDRGSAELSGHRLFAGSVPLETHWTSALFDTSSASGPGRFFHS